MANLFRRKPLSSILSDIEKGYGDGENPESGGKIQLNKVLKVKDLTFMGIAAVVGAGIFSTIGIMLC